MAVLGGLKHSKLLGKGQGRTKKQAETTAACDALNSLSADESLFAGYGQSDPLPRWIRDYCTNEGARMLKAVCGKSINEQHCSAILVPLKHESIAAKCLRSKLAAVGGRVRQALAMDRAFRESPDPKKATLIANVLNDNKRIASVTLESPIGRWIKRLAEDVQFREAIQAGPVISTINSLLGSVFVEHGWEACKHLSLLLFSETGESLSQQEQPARSRLQALLQANFKNRTSEFHRVSTAFTSSRNESHNPTIEATVYVGNVALGSAVASRKKDAIEAASAAALSNPDLQSVIIDILGEFNHETPGK